MAYDAHTNFPYSTVATAPSPAASGTSLVVAAGDGAKFPTVPFNATVWITGANPLTTNAEIVRVTNISTDTLTITRAQESSVARTILVGDQIAATITTKTLTDSETIHEGGIFQIVDAIPRDFVLTASFNYQVENVLEISSAYVLEIPATSSLEITAYTSQSEVGSRTGWYAETTMPVYSSGSATRTRVYTITSDATTRMSVGWKVRFTDTAVKYGIIVALTATTITIDMGTDYVYTSTANPNTFDVSPTKNPLGFPLSEAKWAYEFTSTSSSLQATPVMSTFYNPGSLTFTPPKGVWNTQFFGSFRSQSTAAQTSCQMFVYLSTSNNALADTTGSDMNASTKMLILMGGASGQIEGRLPGMRRFTLTVDGATAIYPVTMTSSTTMQSIGFDNGNSTLYVRLNSVYL